MKNTHLDFKPKYSIVCLIYKSNEWLDFAYQQVIKHTDLNEVEFFFVANDANDGVKKHLKENYIPHYCYETQAEQKTEWYINNVYRAYNYGAKKAKGEYLIFINSDMAYSNDWLPNLINKYDGSNCIASRLIESGRYLSGKYGFEKNFGTEFFNYTEEAFLKYAELYKEKDVLKEGGLYMPLYIKKSDFMEVGMYPEGNILAGTDLYSPTIAKKGEKIGFTGDEALMRKLKNIGIRHTTSFDSIVYHFQAGELSYDKLTSISNTINICIYNDLCIGIMGEKVLWNYLKERLPGNVYCIDKNITGDSGNFEKNANLYLQKHHSDTDIIIQNATFISKMDNHIPTICYLQDDIRKMGQNTLLQEENLKKSTTIIVNSVYTQKSYSEYTSDIIPIGVNQELFKKYDSKVLRGKYNIPQGNVGIFVGSLSETKGWEEIKSIIQTHSRVDHWMIVTKYEEHLQLKNASLFTQVTQETLSELLNCATFFIVGSKVETQCLAAIEAALCDIPLIMRDIGIFQEFSKEDKKMLGEFGDDFAKSIDILLDNKEKYSPRKRIIDKNLDIPGMIEKWIIVISRFLMLERSYEYLGTQNELKQSNIGQKIEIYIRKKILSPIGLGTFSFLRITNINFYKQALYKLLVKAKLYK